MSAISATMGMLGALLGTAPLAALVGAAGWRGAFVTIGAIPLLGALLSFVFVRDHPRGHVEESARVPGLAEVVRGMLEVLGTDTPGRPSSRFFFLYSAMGNLMLWGVPFLRERLRPQQHARGHLRFRVTLALLLSAPLTGYLSDRVFPASQSLPYTVLACCLFSRLDGSRAHARHAAPLGLAALFFAWASPAAASC